MAQKFTRIFGLFCKKICYQEYQKIAQSGHTDDHTYNSKSSPPPKILIFNFSRPWLQFCHDVAVTVKEIVVQIQDLRIWQLWKSNLNENVTDKEEQK